MCILCYVVGFITHVNIRVLFFFGGWGVSNATRSSSRSFYREICVCLTTVAGNAPVAGRKGAINTKQEALLRTSPYKCVEIRLHRCQVGKKKNVTTKFT